MIIIFFLFDAFLCHFLGQNDQWRNKLLINKNKLQTVVLKIYQALHRRTEQPRTLNIKERTRKSLLEFFIPGN